MKDASLKNSLYADSMEFVSHRSRASQNFCRISENCQDVAASENRRESG